MATTFVCYAEALSVLVRKRNRGEISPASFQTAIAALRNDVMDRPAFQLIAVRDVDFAAGTRYVLGQSLNASDAALLSVFLRFAQMSRREGDDCVLITSDRRFLRVADSEGLRVLNPESALPHEVAALVG
jgi:predicted nucleic acid-binding protein